MAPPPDGFLPEFPNRRADNCWETSPRDGGYNCVGWALGLTNARLWPSRDSQWPDGLPRDETIEAFYTLFERFGYTPCPSGDHVAGVERLALYATGAAPATDPGLAVGTPTHVARQTDDGRWTSKLGLGFDVVHSLDALVGPLYGTVVAYFGRPARPDTATPTSPAPARTGAAGAGASAAPGR